jgi:hypothetical protein
MTSTVWVERETTMNAKPLRLPPATFVPLGAGVLRRLQIDFRPICDGRGVMSPDGRFLARATSTYGPRLSAGNKSCYEFFIEDCARVRLQHFKIPMPRDDLINWRLEGLIVWSDNSSSVTFESNSWSLKLLGRSVGTFDQAEFNGIRRNAERQRLSLSWLVERIRTGNDQQLTAAIDLSTDQGGYGIEHAVL